MQKALGINGNGLRVGQSHQRAKLTDREVDTIREMYEPKVCGYRRLARMFDVSRGTIRDIVKCKRRAQVVVGHREVRLPD